MERLSKMAELSVVECRNWDLSSFKLFTISLLTFFIAESFHNVSKDGSEYEIYRYFV